MSFANQPTRHTESILECSGHVCAFFNSKEEKYRVLMPFIKDGLKKGDRAFHIVDPKQRSSHVERLKHEGIDVDAIEASGQLEVRRWEEAYIQDGRFDQFRMIETVKDALAKQKKGEMTRFVGNMEWALQDLPGVHDILEYETRLNQFLPQHADPVVCCYDISQFDARLVMDIMRTHPKVIIGGLLQENPFYVQPEEMLKELKERAIRHN